MYGGLKYVSRAALLAAAVSMGGVAAQAADLGGDCCADLEERVAELEATTARKGNRVMSLTIEGTVGSNLIWHDSDADDAIRPDRATLHDEGEYDAEFTFAGRAAVTSDLTIGFKLDFEAPISEDNEVTTDDVYVFIRSATLGAVQFGRLDGASDGIHSISLANNIGQMTDNGHSDALGGAFATRNDFDGHSTGSGVRYISPTIAGFIFSAAYLHDAEPSDLDISGTADPETEFAERWSVALRYAGEFGPLRVAAGVGYSGSNDDALIIGAENEFIATVSLMHTPTGLFLNGSYGEADADGFTGAAGDSVDETGWTVVAGIEQNWFAIGASTLYGQYYEFENDTDNTDGISWGLGYVQNIDAAAAQFYVQYDMYECVDAAVCSDDANVVTSGFKVEF